MQESGFTNTMTGNNQISGFCYDASGNLLKQSAAPCPSPTYVYNAENQLTSTAGVTYTYDGDGKRVMKSSGTIYWYGMNSDPLIETDLANNDLSAYIFLNGKRVGRQLPTNEVDFYFADALGTSRYAYSLAGANISDYYPFGGERVLSTGTTNHYKFTGKERDSESGLDNFGARYDSSQYGRFMSPDPLGGQTIDPQTLNKYSYVRNNPLNLTDPTGMYTCGDDTADNEPCSSAGDKNFDEQRIIALHSGELETVHAAQAYGDRNQDNGVTVSFKTSTDFKSEGLSGNTEAATNPYKSGHGKTNISVEFRTDLQGIKLEQDLVHEGVHINDDLTFLHSWNSATQKYDSAMNFTHRSTELRAYSAGTTVTRYAAFGIFDFDKINHFLSSSPSYKNILDDLVFPDSTQFPQ